jgi:DNA-binding MarR family transcriptional regulator
VNPTGSLETETDDELLLRIVLDVADLFFKMRAIGRQLGAISSWGGGSWGLLRSLIVEGPQTVPQLAASRPVARQRIQLIANELAAEGLVAFVDNPAHKRSKLLCATPAGEGRYVEVRDRLLALCAGFAGNFDSADLLTTAATLERFEAFAVAWLDDHPEQ